MNPEFDSNPCPICAGRVRSRSLAEDRQDWRLSCETCGDHRIRDSALQYLAACPENFTELDRARIAHGVRKLPADAVITNKLIDGFKRRVRLPTALEQIDRLISFMAETFRPGQIERLSSKALRAYLGCVKTEEVQWVQRQAIKTGVIEAEPGTAGEALTAQGWKRYEEMQRQGHGSRRAFMAMEFKDKALWTAFERHMQPAVKATGFELLTTDDAKVKTAGSIVARMKVEIRTSRFVVCDLSHGNRGAYWEAGFAEGLGRPVIYTCRANVLDDKNHTDHPHFDTAQQLIIKWDPANPAPGMQQLKDVIRATLPDEAKLTDD